MSFVAFALPAVILVSLTSVALLVIKDWRISIIALALQYMGIFSLTALNWPVEMAVTKLVAGWMAGAVLGMAVVSVPSSETNQPVINAGRASITRQLFPLFAAILVGMAVFSVAPQVTGLMPGIDLMQSWGGLILIGMGLLHLGFTAQPFRTSLGLLTILSGFEVLYAAVETSALVAGLLAAVNLGLALVGSYLLMAPQMEETE